MTTDQQQKVANLALGCVVCAAIFLVAMIGISLIIGGAHG